MFIGDCNVIIFIIVQLIYKNRHNVPKSVETSRESKVNLLWNQQVKKTEPFLTLNRTS